MKTNKAIRSGHFARYVAGGWLAAMLALLPSFAQAQPIQAWVQRYNGPGNSTDYATSIAVDASGNVYVAGSSYSSGINVDYATIKYSSAGVPLWTNRYSGPANGEDYSYGVAADSSNNVN